MPTRVLTAHLPADLAREVDRAAARLDRSRAWIVQKALADWLALEKARERMTREALADVDAGRVVDHAAVRAWAADLGGPTPKKR